MSNRYESEPDIPRYEIAERALAEIEQTLEHMEGSDWSYTRPAKDIRHVVELAKARLRMMSLRRRRPGSRWIGQVTSFSWPRKFAGEWGGDPDPHLCFMVDITDGPQTARDKRIEVHVSEGEAERLAHQILDMAASRKKATAKGER